MTTSEKAREWGYSESMVRKLCRSGVIPPAEKVAVKWDIPDRWPKPPLTRHKLCFLLDTINLIHNGSSYTDFKLGYLEDVIKESFQYLISVGFMTEIDINHIDRDLETAAITTRGVDLMRREENDSNGSIHFHLRAGGNINLGVASLNAEVGINN